MKNKLKDVLALIGGAWVVLEALHYLTSAGIVRLPGLGGN
jgi:hypothetical protein